MTTKVTFKKGEYGENSAKLLDSILIGFCADKSLDVLKAMHAKHPVVAFDGLSLGFGNDFGGYCIESINQEALYLHQGVAGNSTFADLDLKKPSSQQDLIQNIEFANAIHNVNIFGVADHIESDLKLAKKEVVKLKLSEGISQSFYRLLFFADKSYHVNNILGVKSPTDYDSMAEGFKYIDRVRSLKELNGNAIMFKRMNGYSKKNLEKGFTQIKNFIDTYKKVVSVYFDKKEVVVDDLVCLIKKN